MKDLSVSRTSIVVVLLFQLPGETIPSLTNHCLKQNWGLINPITDWGYDQRYLMWGGLLDPIRYTFLAPLKSFVLGCIFYWVKMIFGYI